MWFKYVAYNAEGNMTAGELEAASEQAAETVLWQSNMIIVSLQKKMAAPTLDEALPLFSRVSRNDVVAFARDMATLLGSGIAIIPALHMLYQRTEKTGMKKVIRQLIGDVETGSPFSEACSRHPKVFSPFFMRMTRVGEEVGNLEQMLKDITIHMEKEAAVTSKVRGAMIYPTFVIAVAVVAAGIVFGFVIPALSGLFEAYGGDLPIFTRMMLGLSDFVNAAIVYLVLSLACLLFLGWWYFKTPAGKRTKDSMVWRLPVMGKIVVMGTMSRLARTMAVLIRGGITLTEALELVIQTTDHAQMKEALVKVHSDVHAGVSMSQALQEQPVFPPLFGQVVAVGEQSGRLEANLETMADFYETETDRAVSRATAMLGPLLIIGVGVAVGFIALSVITPIYDLMGQIE